MRSQRVFHAVDSHTEGMPTRVIVGGMGVLPGATMEERRQWFMANSDDVRTLLMNEPRGHSAMSGAILQPPTRPDADFGVLYIEVSGCLPMCGHGTIGVATVLVETGMVPVVEPVTTIRLDTPAGLVIADVAVADGHAERVTIRNVPSFVVGLDRTVEVPGYGEVSYDLAFGGNFYAIVDPQENFKGIENHTADQLISWSRECRKRMNEQYTFVHPENEHIKGLSHFLWTGAPLDPTSTARNAVFYGDKAIDRSPCGTGTSARMAQWHAKGKLKKGDRFVHESIIGSKFIGTVEEETTIGDKPAMIPGIEGWAVITGHNTIFIDDEEDPYAFGFQVI